MSCATKAVQQAYEVQRRLRVWRPQVAYVMGAGQIGLLSTLVLRLRGLDVYTLARSEPPSLKAEIVERCGALREHAQHSPAGTGSPGRQSRSDHRRHRQQRRGIRIDATARSQRSAGLDERDWRLTAHRSAVGQGESRLGARQQAAAGKRQRQPRALRDGHQGPVLGEVMYPGVIERILTTPIRGLDRYGDMMNAPLTIRRR